jgi:1,4-alpha-glucan branching enzyme
MDATDFMNMYQGSGWGVMQRFNDEIDNRWADKIAIAEQLPDDSWVTRPTSLGGAGFDAQWYDAFVDKLRAQVLQAGWNQSLVNMSDIQSIINGGGLYLSNTSVANYLELHDEAWSESGGERLVRTIDTTAPYDDIYAKGRTKMAQGIVMLAPGIPMILQGTEWLEDTNFGSGTPGGGDRIDWNHKTLYAEIFQYYKDLIAVRKSNCACRADAGHQVFHVNNALPGKVIAWQRWDLSGNVLVMVANFSNDNHTNYAITLPQEGTWYEILNSQALEYDGNGMGNGGVVVAGSGGAATMTIPQMGLVVLRFEDPPGRSSDLEGGDADTDLRDFAAFQQQFGKRGCGLAADLNEDGRVNLDDFTELNANLTGPLQ